MLDTINTDKIQRFLDAVWPDCEYKASELRYLRADARGVSVTPTGNRYGDWIVFPEDHDRTGIVAGLEALGLDGHSGIVEVEMLSGAYRVEYLSGVISDGENLREVRVGRIEP